MKTKIKKVGFFLIFLAMLLITVSSAWGGLQTGVKPKDPDLNMPLVEVKFDKAMQLNAKDVYSSFGKIFIDSNKFPQYKNASATITFKNICLDNPIVLHNGLWDKKTIIKQTGLCQYTFWVKGFSSWELVDNNWTGTHENTTVYAKGLGLAPDSILIISGEEEPIGVNITDESYYQNNGTLYNGTEWNETYGYDGTGGFYFDGVDDFISFPDSDSLDSGTGVKQPRAVSMWIKYTSTAGSEVLMEKGSGQGYYLLTSTNGRMRWGCSGTVDVTESSASFNDGSWHWLYVDYNGSRLRIYNDNVKVAETNNTNNCPVQNAGTLRIGSREGDFPIEASIDEVRIFNRTLSDEEREKLFDDYERPMKYFASGKYTTPIYNASDYYQDYYNNIWTATVLEETEEIFAIWGKADECSTIASQDYIAGSFESENSYENASDIAPSSYTLHSGSLISGNLNSLANNDNDYMTIRQQITSPKVYSEFNFTGVSTAGHVNLIFRYNYGRGVIIGAKNWSSGYFGELKTIPTSGGWQTLEFNLHPDYLDSGRVNIILYEEGTGDIDKTYDIEMIKIGEDTIEEDYLWTFNIEGQCSQFYMLLEGDTEEITTNQNITIKSYLLLLPQLEEATITTPYPIYTNTLVEGQARYITNQTTPDGQVTVQWYVNDVYVYEEDLMNIANNTLVNFSLPIIYYEKGDIINFSAEPIDNTPYNSIAGTIKWSNRTVTINNSNFTFDYSPTELNLTISESQNQKFQILNLFDVDDDVNITWYLSGSQVGTGTSYNFAGDYDKQGNYTVLVILTDGEFTQNVTWDLEATNVEVDWELVGVIALVSFIAILLLLFALIGDDHSALKLFFLGLIPYASLLLIRYAQHVVSAASSTTLNTIFNSLYRIGMVFAVLQTFYLFLFLLWKIVKFYKFRKKKFEDFEG